MCRARLRRCARHPRYRLHEAAVDFQGFSNVSRPVFAGALVILDTGYMKPQLWAVRPDGQGDVTKTHVAWRVSAQVPANPSPVVVGQELYMVSDQGVLSCLDVSSGKERFKSRLGGNYSASPIAAAGRVYFCAEEGETVVIEAGTRFRELAQQAPGPDHGFAGGCRRGNFSAHRHAPVSHRATGKRERSRAVDSVAPSRRSGTPRAWQ